MIAEANEADEVSTCEVVDTKGGSAARRGKRWPEAVKRLIVAETRAAGRSASVAARRHDVERQPGVQVAPAVRSGCRR
jgi:hypothetical protein